MPESRDRLNSSSTAGVVVVLLLLKRTTSVIYTVAVIRLLEELPAMDG